MSPESVITRSAQLKAGVDAAKAIVVAPFADAEFLASPGGDGVGTREYDPGRHSTARETIAAPLTLSFGQGSVSDGTDALDAVVFPAAPYGDPPTWISSRGHEARAFDRRLGREVYGPHAFERPTDIIVTNGIIRFWLLAAGQLAVDAVNGGSWHHVGFLSIGAGPVTVARLVSVTPDRVRLSVRAGGPAVTVECRRGERMVRLSDAVNANWAALPPTIQHHGAASTPGVFGKAADFAAADLIEVAWPSTKESWAFAGWWIPADDSATQGDSGIWYAADSSGPASTLFFRSGVLEWTQDGDTLSSASLTFDAEEPVFIALSYSAGARRMSVKVESGAIAHVTDVVGSGTADANFSSFVLAPLFGDLGGYSDTYSDTYDLAGAGTWAFDNAMVFEEGLSADEAETLSAATTGLDGLPDPESRLAWFSHFDDLADSGLTRGMVTVGDDQGAYLALAGSDFDDVDDHIAQFGAEFEQQTRVR